MFLPSRSRTRRRPRRFEQHAGRVGDHADERALVALLLLLDAVRRRRREPHVVVIEGAHHIFRGGDSGQAEARALAGELILQRLAADRQACVHVGDRAGGCLGHRAATDRARGSVRRGRQTGRAAGTGPGTGSRRVPEPARGW